MSEADQSAPSSTPFEPKSLTGGTLHHFRPSLTAYEHAPQQPITADSKSLNTLIFINGLYGTPLSVSYPHQTLLSHLPPNWVLAEPLLSSSGTGFGTSSIARDAKELDALVSYLRHKRPEGKIVLLGHSTGCQDALHYVSTAAAAAAADKDGSEQRKRARVDGVVLQAPASDREGIEGMTTEDKERDALRAVTAKAAAWAADGRGEHVLPASDTGAVYPRAPVTATRWLSLLSPAPQHAGEDDLFSSDLGAARWRETFGRAPRGLRWLVLHMGADQFVPESVDKAALVDEWRAAVLEGGGVWDHWSGVLPGADHALERCADEVRADFANRVGIFLGGI